MNSKKDLIITNIRYSVRLLFIKNRCTFIGDPASTESIMVPKKLADKLANICNGRDGNEYFFVSNSIDAVIAVQAKAILFSKDCLLREHDVIEQSFQIFTIETQTSLGKFF